MRKTTSKAVLVLSQLVLVAVLSLAGSLAGSLRGPALAAEASGPAKTDSEIQQCISERLAASPALKDQGLTASVSNGVATLSGTARNPGSKGTATRLAKKCGATGVTNNITISPSYKPVKKPVSEKKV